MSDRESRAEAILDVAEDLARTQGYNGFSFRDLAQAVGIKSASVHYHFPTKADLGAALARRYTERFLAALGAPDEPGLDPAGRLARYIETFRRSLAVDGQMCLCGMLGAEIAALPLEVANEARGFFDRNLEWLEAALTPRGAQTGRGDVETHDRALTVLAALEGAMLLSRSLGELGVFDRIAARLTRYEGGG